MSALALLPPRIRALYANVIECTQPGHLHRNPYIEIVKFRLCGVDVDIESELDSGKYNVRVGNDSVLEVRARTAAAFLLRKEKELKDNEKKLA